MSDPKKPYVSWTTVPAQPGWFMLFADSTETSEGRITGFIEMPVIAWIIRVQPHDPDDPFIDVTPVTAEGSQWTPQDLLLKDPQGKLLAPGDREFRTIEEARRWAEESRVVREKQRVKGRNR